jgi:hypothetical protein
MMTVSQAGSERKTVRRDEASSGNLVTGLHKQSMNFQASRG